MADVPLEPTPTTGPAATAPPADTAPQPPPPRPHVAMAEPNGSTPIPDLANGSTHIRPGGAPARVYLNELVVPHLLEGMKSVARDQPSNPLRVLGEFLIQKSIEIEGDSKRGS